MPTPLAQKLKIKEGYTLLTINAPADFKKELGPLPDAVSISSTAKDFQQIHWFILNKAQLDKELPKVMPLVKDEVLCWCYYPKGTSALQTDLTRDKGWDNLLKHEQFHWISLISFNDTWSVFAFRLKTEADKKKEAKPQERPILDYIDPQKKTVRLPDDLKAVLSKNKKAISFFESLSFTNKKEYVEWVVTAKHPETRKERISGTMERLLQGWKNPRNT
ncbi:MULTISPECIES: YdeI/OmpD-associated family protein [Niastella]|uniref:YdeI/OmpD-associated family protein n=1 Tax=Niastella soli TaxID=2821487 RepID=A0ABS3YVU8_9BACT|nr:YdeI/OmpD-associated family protein [Niastella soli]MBO9201993.1 YdeI/OmpD-associated family protein [Niastella soli]